MSDCLDFNHWKIVYRYFYIFIKYKMFIEHLPEYKYILVESYLESITSGGDVCLFVVCK